MPNPDAPVAVCGVSQNPIEPPFETALFDGTASYDPNGGEITSYSWTLAGAPSGSTVGLDSPSSATTGFTPQLAGDYVVELRVQNNFGITSEPCTIQLQAVPGQDLWVEMFWNFPNDDMDLHLLAPGGTPRTSSDCNFANTNPDWGQLGNHDDDPSLDLDDIPGTGPENINISDPASGIYTVFVHDYPITGPREEPTDVTVNIYLGGDQVFSDTRRIVGEDTDTYYATIDPDARVVQPL